MVLTARLVARIDRFMADRGWSHNEFYHRWILRRLPSTMSRALDVGCGTGDLVRALARRAAHVDGIDRDADMIDQARRSSPAGGRTSFTVASLLDIPTSPRYDAVTAVAVLHHVPFAEAVRHLAALLAPGGTLLVVGCYQQERRDRALDLIAVPANMVIGSYRRRRHRGAPASMTAPTAPATMPFSAVRATAQRMLPGCHLRRALFWRYLLHYTAPPRRRD